jgi:hypothetical protein
MPERPLGERIYRMLVVTAIGVWVLVLVNIPSALNAAWWLLTWFGGGGGPGD